MMSFVTGCFQSTHTIINSPCCKNYLILEASTIKKMNRKDLEQIAKINNCIEKINNPKYNKLVNKN